MNTFVAAKRSEMRTALENNQRHWLIREPTTQRLTIATAEGREICGGTR